MKTMTPQKGASKGKREAKEGLGVGSLIAAGVVARPPPLSSSALLGGTVVDFGPGIRSLAQSKLQVGELVGKQTNECLQEVSCLAMFLS